MKEITKQEIEKLIKKGFLKNTHRGFINRKGNHVGFYQTVHKKYIEDWYADKVKTLL